MRIGMVLDGSYPSDIRVRKEAESLAEFHDVFVLCTKGTQDVEYEEVNGVKVLRTIGYKSHSYRGWIDVLTAIDFIHPLFKKQLPKFIQENKIDVLHVHDLPLAKTVLLASRKYATKAVLDLHENYPAALLTWFSWRKSQMIKLKNKIFFNYNRWRRYESKMIKEYDVLIAVVDEMKERLIEHHKIDGEKITVVTNSEKKELANNFTTDTTNYFSDYHDRFIISYVGGFGPHRGLHTAIQGMEKVSKKIPNVLLVLVGPSNYDVRSHLEALIHEHALEGFVDIKGTEPFEKVVNIMKNSQINIIPHISNEHTESTMPHKFYQILLSGKPMLVSDCAPMKRIIEEKGLGSYFKAEDPESFADEVIKIHQNYQEALEKSALGFDEAYNRELNWEHTSKELLILYDKLSH